MCLLRALDAAKVELVSIQLARPTLDDVFLTLTGRSLREDIHDGAAA
jgi:ABC-2 type transport system ATP-binding protein